MESEPGQGSTFFVSVRLQRGDPLQERNHRDAAEASGHTGPIMNVLLAEDNKVNQLIARKILEKLGIESQRWSMDVKRCKHGSHAAST